MNLKIIIPILIVIGFVINSYFFCNAIGQYCGLTSGSIIEFTGHIKTLDKTLASGIFFAYLFLILISIVYIIFISEENEKTKS